MPEAIVLAVEARTAIAEAAAAAWPHEFVGLLAGHSTPAGWFVDRVAPLPDAARGADRFLVQPAAFAAAEAELRAQRRTWLGFVHSHPRGDASPSLADRGHLWRDCLQLIVAGDGRGPGALRAFWLSGDRVEPLPLQEQACPEQASQEQA